jgi:DNA-binding CsgD family transcriptional regulator
VRAEAPAPVMVEDRPLRERLTPREFEIVGWIVKGKTNKEIATILSLTEHTIKNYLLRVFEKIGCDNRVTLAVRYVREVELES